MSNIEYYMRLKYPMSMEPGEEGGFVITYPDLPGIVAEGETIEQAMAAAEELRRQWTEVKLENGWEVPLPGELKTCNGTLPPSNEKSRLV